MNAKAIKIIFWSTTGIIALTQGVINLLMVSKPETIQGMAHLGYPVYFITMLAILKLLGSIVLIIPQVPHRFKEWAYGCFGIEFLCAAYSLVAVDGFSVNVVIAFVFLGILSVSYWAYSKLKN